MIAQSLLSPIGDGCPSCGARVAADQRYCVECGERRAEPRLPFMDGRPRAAQQAPPAALASRRVPSSAGTTLIAGVGTLLLAMGVGVLIGRSGDTRATQASRGVQVVTLDGPASAPTPGAATASSVRSTATGDAAKSKHAKGSAHAKAPKAKAVKTPPPTVAVGSPGHGKGYKNGKFTGDFFGQ
jgi:hypothetical protein